MEDITSKEATNSKQNEEKRIVMYSAKEISELFQVNINKATDFLKKFGIHIGHWQIEETKLLKVLAENEGFNFKKESRK